MLSSRETEVLDFITKGFTMNEIAELMQLSHFTVRSFVRRIYGKLKVTSKAEAIYEARTRGLLSD
jgi:DNA-binding NarL/FixJ family response regulator